jgi:hypothetical protein
MISANWATTLTKWMTSERMLFAARITN